MKRWLIVLAVLFATSVTANADYVLIRYILGGKKEGNQPGAPGTPGGPGTPGTPGGPPGGGPGGGDDGNIPSMASGGQSAEVDTAALSVMAVVEVKTRQPVPGMRILNSNVTTKYSVGQGYTRLYNDDVSLQTRLLPAISPHRHFNKIKEAAFKNRTSDKVFELADWCLTHGLHDDFVSLMDSLVSKKDDEQSSNSERLRDAVKAYAAVKAALDKPIDKDTYSGFWKSRLSARDEQSLHFTVIYNASASNPPEVQTRLKALETNMKAFYYWFALRGIVLPMPKDKLVAVVIDSPDEFRKQRAILEDEPLVTDGFYATRDHVAVFSSQRIDQPYQAFVRTTQGIWTQGYSKQGLLEGSAKKSLALPPSEWARFQTLALLEKGLEVEGERAAVSHEGSRQLMVASGIMPRTVVPPQWAAFGTASVFETPKGPFPGAPLEASVAWFPGTGGPSWAYQRTFRDWEKTNKLGEPAELLRSVVTDRFFNNVQGVRDRAGLLKARGTAWALAFFLMKERLPGMMRYCQELSSLPRDIEIDSDTLLACFARAFDVANATQDKPDPAKFEELAKNWISYTKGLSAPGAEFGLDPKKPDGPDPNNPGGPGNDAPGGAPGGAPPGRPKGGRG